MLNVGMESGAMLKVRTPFGNILEIEVKVGDTIKNVKEKISDKECYPVDEQEFYYYGSEQLPDTYAFTTEDIHKFRISEFMIHLILRRANRRPNVGMEIDAFDVTVYTLNGQNTRVSIAAGMSVEQVKQQILDQVGYPIDRQRLLKNNIELKDGELFVNDLLEDVLYGKAGLTLVLRRNDPRYDVVSSSRDRKIQVFVKTLDGETITLNVPEYSTVADVKQQISNKGDYPTDLQILISEGKELSDEYVFQGPVNLHLVMKKPGPAPPDEKATDQTLQLYIKPVRGPGFHIYISVGETVFEAKQKIFELEGISIDRQLLISYGEGLRDEQRFEGELLRKIASSGQLQLVVTKLDPIPPLLPGLGPVAVRPERLFEACMAHMELSIELSRLKDDSKTEYGLAKALVDIELRYLQDPSKPRIAFDFERPRPEEKMTN